MQYKVEIECGGALLKSLPKCKMTFLGLAKKCHVFYFVCRGAFSREQ